MKFPVFGWRAGNPEPLVWRGLLTGQSLCPKSLGQYIEYTYRPLVAPVLVRERTAVKLCEIDEAGRFGLSVPSLNRI